MAEEDRELFQEAISGFEVFVFGRLLPWGEFCRDLRAWLLDTGQVPVEGKLESSPRERELSRRLSLAKREYLAGDMAEEDRELFQEAISGFELLVDGRLLPWGKFCRELRAWLLHAGQVPVEGKLENSPGERELSRRLSLAKREYLAGDMAEEDRELFQEAISGFEVLVFGRLLPLGEFCRELRAWLVRSGKPPLAGVLANDQFERELGRRLSLAKREYLAGDMAEEDRELFQEAISGFELLVDGRLLPWGEFCRELRAWLLDAGQVPVQGELASSPRERGLSRRLSLAKREYLAGDMVEEDRELFQEAISGFEVLVFGPLLPWGEFCRELRAWLQDTGQVPVQGKLASSPRERGLSRRLSLAKREYLAGDMAEEDRELFQEDRELFQEAISGFEVLVFGPLLPWGEFCRELRAWLLDAGQVPVQGKLASSPRERELSRRLRLAKRDTWQVIWRRRTGSCSRRPSVVSRSWSSAGCCRGESFAASCVPGCWILVRSPFRENSRAAPARES
ncbi:unnamed protein product [Prorocentrum cordatum]|uniref:PD-(D/E)XK nuclease family protein n=1 Tax=Prorocentrum cordatum TaxID=2364126 RepID=A0ABN9SRC8_9DINO|nr:unnamed protein product [Polarella glacialis]